MYEAAGRHVTVDGRCADPALLNDASALLGVMTDAVTAAGATVLGELAHAFSPQGVTALLLLSESHASIHTYPEIGAYMADIFTCGDVDPVPAARAIAAALGGCATFRIIHRGGVSALSGADTNALPCDEPPLSPPSQE
jgi:S-adenosylmethionine decarboxylase